MPKATNTPTTSRRCLLAGSAAGTLAAAVGLPAAAAAPHPDAELIAACTAFDDLERAFIATHGGYFDDDTPEAVAAQAEQKRLQAEQEPLLDVICELRATTMDGHVARARSLALYAPDVMGPQGGVDGCLTQAIVRDLLAGSGVA